MDISKLPKFSESPPPPPASPSPTDETQPAMPMPARPYQQAGLGADVWVSVIIGLLMIYMGLNFGKFLVAKLSGQPYHTNVNWMEGAQAGKEVSYFELQGFTAWTDMGVFLFGMVLLLEAAAKAAVAIRPGYMSRFILFLAVVLTLATVLLNLFVCYRLMSVQITPIISGLAVAFGGWILVDEWRMLRN
jgi:hypothetical protein